MNEAEVGERGVALAHEFISFMVVDEATWNQADEILGRLNAAKKNIDKAYDDLIKAAHESWKKALAKKAGYYEPVDAAARMIKGRMADYKQLMAKKKREEEERILQQQIQEEEERLLKEAEENPSEADEILSTPVMVAPVILQDEVKSKSTRFRTHWDIEVVDFMALVKAVAEGKVAPVALTANETFLKNQARDLKEHFNYPGVRSFSRMV